MLSIFAQNVFLIIFLEEVLPVLARPSAKSLSSCLIFNNSLENKNLELKSLTLKTRKERKQWN